MGTDRYPDMGYMDRLDYVSMVAGEHGFCMAVESGYRIYPDSTAIWSKTGS